MTMRLPVRVIGVVLVVVLTASTIGAALALRRYHETRGAELADLSVANLTFERALAGARRLRDAGTEGPKAFANDYLESDQDSIASADLQSRLRALALGQQVELASLTPLPVRTRGETSLTGVRLAFRAPLAPLQALLHAVEAQANPLLFIDRLVIRAEDSTLRESSGSEPNAVLTVELDVSAPKRPRVLVVPLAQAPIRIEPAAGGVRP